MIFQERRKKKLAHLAGKIEYTQKPSVSRNMLSTLLFAHCLPSGQLEGNVVNYDSEKSEMS